MTFTIVQNDTAPSIISTLTDSGEPIDLSGVNNIRFYVQDEYKNVVISDELQGNGRVGILDKTGGKVEYVFTSDDTQNVGSYEGEWEVIYGDGSRETFPSRGSVDIEIVEQIE